MAKSVPFPDWRALVACPVGATTKTTKTGAVFVVGPKGEPLTEGAVSVAAIYALALAFGEKRAVRVEIDDDVPATDFESSTA